MFKGHSHFLCVPNFFLFLHWVDFFLTIFRTISILRKLILCLVICLNIVFQLVSYVLMVFKISFPGNIYFNIRETINSLSLVLFQCLQLQDTDIKKKSLENSYSISIISVLGILIGNTFWSLRNKEMGSLIRGILCARSLANTECLLCTKDVQGTG